MPEHPGFDLRPIDGRSVVRLRVRPGDAEAVREALHLPAALSWQEGDPVACWLGPDQWLLTSDSQPGADIIDHIDRTLSGQLYAATEMSSGYACFELSGPVARTVLAMGCGIDMHPGAFTPGQCVRTQFANLILLIVCVGNDRFILYADRSQAGYLADWIANAGDDPITYMQNDGELS
jgi:sarcosine oxidase subunit gamma